MECTKVRVLVFDRHNYVLWSGRMKVYVQAQGYDVWKSVKTRYTKLSTLPTNDVGKNLYDSNAKVVSAILNGLKKLAYVKVTHLK